MKTRTLIASTLGVILATSAVSALAAREDRENLSRCKADIAALYGENTRMRLRSIRRGAAETKMRLMVTPRDAGNQVVVCSVDRSGTVRLSDREGIALVPAADGATLSKAH